MDKIKLLLYGIFAYLQLDKEVFMILMLLMCIDTLAGALKAIRLGDEFRFRILLWGMTMKFVFLLIPMIVALVGKSLGYDFRIGINIIMSILTVAEAYSALGNIYAAKNRVEVKKIDAISMVINSLRQMLSQIMHNLLNTLKNLGNKE